MKLKKSKLVISVLIGLIIILLLLNIASYVHLYLTDGDPNSFFFRKTNFNEEKNAPSIFSSLLHFFASFLLGVIGRSRLQIKIWTKLWWILSFIFFFLGLDELLRIHEKLGGNFLEGSGLFLYSWITYYCIALLLIGILILKPLLELPRNTLKKFITAGAIFLTGAIGLENFTGGYVHGQELEEFLIIHSPPVFLLYTIEELFEMVGITWFIYSLLIFLERYKIREPAL